MPEPNLHRIFISRFNKFGARYMVTGATASIIYGEPRLTNDIDLVMDLLPAEVELFLDAFPIEDFYCPPSEVIHIEIGRAMGGQFNLIHHETGFKADIYTAGRDELNNWGLNNRKQIQVDNDELWLASVEYVILRKLDYYREGKSEKHLRDISGMLAVSHDQIDFKILSDKIQNMDLDAVWSIAEKFKF